MLLPIRICSFNKTGITRGYLKDHYNSDMLVYFFKKFPRRHAILSRKYGICVSWKQYDAYDSVEMLPDAELLELLRSQAPLYIDVTFLYWNHRPVTHQKWVKMLQDAGFDVKEFRTLDEIDAAMHGTLFDHVS